MSRRTSGRLALGAALLVGCGTLAQEAAAQASPQPARAGARPAVAQLSRPCTSVRSDPTTYVTLGKSTVVRLATPAARIVVGGQGNSRAGLVGAGQQAPSPAAAPSPVATPGSTSGEGVADTDVTLLSPTELFLLGRKTGSMNLVIQGTDGACVIKDVVVTIDPATLQAELVDVMPEEPGLKVRGAETSLVLSGTISDAAKLQQVLAIANSYADVKKIVNLVRVTAPQQVMLEVKIAEVSKSLMDRLGLNFERAFTNGAGVTNIISGFIGGGASLLSRTHGGPGLPNGATSSTQLGIDATKNDGIVRVLAEPNIVAISGQSASFLSGGKIFIPVAQGAVGGGAAVITLEEKEFGVGLRFTPTVLDGRVNLKIVSEVSELSQTGTPFTSVAGQVSVLPSMTTRRVDTTVQLADGQSFAVAGLIKNNMTEALNKFPGLGEAPVLGALFRSSEFQRNQTELMFVVTPHLVKPLATAVALPTDVHVEPSRSDVMLMGTGEGARGPAAPATVAPGPAPAAAPAPPPAPAPAPASGAQHGQAQSAAPADAAVAVPVVPAAPQPAPQARPAAVSSSELRGEPLQPLAGASASPVQTALSSPATATAADSAQ